MLAVTSLKRSVAFPDVPTLAESGYPDFDLNDWNGLFAATGIPPALVDRMQAVVAEAIKDPRVRERLDPTGADLVANTPVQFRTWIVGRLCRLRRPERNDRPMTSMRGSRRNKRNKRNNWRLEEVPGRVVSIYRDTAARRIALEPGVTRL